MMTYIMTNPLLCTLFLLLIASIIVIVLNFIDVLYKHFLHKEEKRMKAEYEKANGVRYTEI